MTRSAKRTSKDPRTMNPSQSLQLGGGVVFLVAAIMSARIALGSTGASVSLMLLIVLLLMIGSSLISRMTEDLGDSQVFPFFNRIHGDAGMLWGSVYIGVLALALFGALTTRSAFSAFVLACLTAAIYVLATLYQRYLEKRKRYESLLEDHP